MKRYEGLLFLFALLAQVSSALAQTETSQPAHELPKEIVVARCAYTSAGGACPSADNAGQGAHDPGGNALVAQNVAQLPWRMGGSPFRGGYPQMGGPGYPGMWQSAPSGRHALIGAVIGGLIGWAVAAKGNSGVHATFGIATVGAGLGAAMGLAVPSFPVRNPYFRRWPDDEDEQGSGRKSAKPGPTPGSRQTASADTTWPNRRPSAEDSSSSKAAAP